jgi:hypothetical protein
MPARDDAKGTGPDRGRRADEIVTFTPEPAENAGGALADSSIVLGLEEFVRAVTELGIADAAELQALAADPGAAVLGLSRRLVNAGKLTPYQAAALSNTLLIGNYLIPDMLGHGGIGSAFRARHRQSGRGGTLKVVPAALANEHQRGNAPAPRSRGGSAARPPQPRGPNRRRLRPRRSFHRDGFCRWARPRPDRAPAWTLASQSGDRLLDPGCSRPPMPS